MSFQKRGTLQSGPYRLGGHARLRHSNTALGREYWSIVSGRTLDTLLASKLKTKHCIATSWRQDPLAVFHWWIVANVLVVSACELSNPMPQVVKMIAGNRLPHTAVRIIHREPTSQSGMMGLAELTRSSIVTLAKAFSVDS